MFSAMLWLGVFAVIAFALFGGRLGRLGVLVFLGFVGMLVVASAIYVSSYYSTEQILEAYVLRITNALGISPLFAKSIALLAVIPAGTAIAWSTSKDYLKRNIGRYTLAICAACYYSILAFVSGDLRVTKTGVALQCYVIAEDGVHWKDLSFEGVDPKTGRECVKAKTNMLPTLKKLDELLRSGTPLTAFDPKGRFFNSIGEPVVWYADTESGLPEFFEYPGFHPKTGVKLLPITKERVDAFERETEARRLQDANKKLEDDKRIRAEQLRSFIVAPNRRTGVRTIGLMLSPSTSAVAGAANSALLEQIATHFAKSDTMVVPIFDPSFYSSPYYQEILAGRGGTLVEGSVFERVDAVLLVQPESFCAKAQSQVGLVSCELTVNHVLFSANGDSISGGTIKETAPGTNEGSALKRATELILERHSQRLFASVQ